jgi:phosphoribosyl-AMP cyclohydrolase
MAPLSRACSPEAAHEIAQSMVFDANGLIPAIAQDEQTGQVLMLAWMNRAALVETIMTGRVCYWSRSRQSLWRKGATSCHTQELAWLRLDCDGDCLLIGVRQRGPACHTGERSCFFRDPLDRAMSADRTKDS